MLWDIETFMGELPRLDKASLPAGYAVRAENCDLSANTIRPLLKPAAGTPSSWTFINTAGVDVVPATVSGVERLLVSGLTTYPEARQGTTTRRWGVVTPTTIPTVTLAGTPAAGAVTVATVSYYYTLVTSWGEESAPSTASMPVDVPQGQYLKISNIDITATGNDVAHIRVYRSATSDTGVAEYQNAAMRPTAGGTAAYDVPVAQVNDPSDEVFDVNDDQDGLNDSLGSVCVTDGWDPPPVAAHSGVEVVNGVYALLLGNRVFLSVPGFYYAFPAGGLLDYTFELQYTGVGLGVHNHQLVVCTTAYPEIISGVDPASAVRYQIPWNYPCVSKQSIVSTPAGVFYASTSGGCLISGASGDPLITRRLFRPEQWLAYSPEDMICAYWRGNIYCFFSGQDHGFILRLADKDVVTIDNLGINVTGVFVDEVEDMLYLNTAAGWYEWEAGTDCLEAVYQTGDLRTHPTAMSCARVSASSYSATMPEVAVVADGATLHTQSPVVSAEVFRLPGGARARRWSMIATSDGPEIDGLYLANDPGEMIRQ